MGVAPRRHCALGAALRGTAQVKNFSMPQAMRSSAKSCATWESRIAEGRRSPLPLWTLLALRVRSTPVCVTGRSCSGLARSGAGSTCQAGQPLDRRIGKNAVRGRLYGDRTSWQVRRRLHSQGGHSRPVRIRRPTMVRLCLITSLQALWPQTQRKGAGRSRQSFPRRSRCRSIH